MVGIQGVGLGCWGGGGGHQCFSLKNISIYYYSTMKNQLLQLTGNTADTVCPLFTIILHESQTIIVNRKYC